MADETNLSSKLPVADRTREVYFIIGTQSRNKSWVPGSLHCHKVNCMTCISRYLRITPTETFLCLLETVT